jgi:predicted transcriptional regulator of viral defense system
MSPLLNTLLSSPVPFSHGVLLSALPDYREPNDKVANLLVQGVLIGLKRGLYISAKSVQAAGAQTILPLVSNVLYGPSYASGAFALAHYGLIPEGVHNLTAMTTRRAKHYDTPLGSVDYVHCQPAWYAVGVQVSQQSGWTHLIATPEKALCDKVVFTKQAGLTSLKSMHHYLYEDLRLDEPAARDLDVSVIRACAQAAAQLNYKAKTMSLLLTAFTKMKVTV